MELWATSVKIGKHDFLPESYDVDLESILLSFKY